MTQITIKPVTSGKEKKQFLNLPWQIYRDDENWIPPLRTNQKELVGFKHHPFYDDAESQAFLALEEGKPVGRILAIVNHAHNRKYKEKRGFFGFFETIDNREVSAGLLDAASGWLKEQGMDAMRGPINPSLNYECGLLIDGFDRPPTFMMTYNHLYYASHLEAYGCEKVEDLYAFFGHVDMIDGLDKKLEFIVQEAKRRFNIVIRPLNKNNFKQDLDHFLNIYNKSLDGTWGFTPISKSETKHMGASLKHLIVPELSVIGEVDGKPIGCCFALLDYNPRIKLIDGKLFPFGFMKLFSNRRKIKRVRMISTNVLPEYQQWGVGLVLLNGLLPQVLDWGIEEAEFSWVLESNQLSRRSLEKGGAKITNTYRIYDRSILD